MNKERRERDKEGKISKYAENAGKIEEKRESQDEKEQRHKLNNRLVEIICLPCDKQMERTQVYIDKRRNTLKLLGSQNSTR